jgi:2-oxoisovalerate ferredoxin oxidoreductase beta subunit
MAGEKTVLRKPTGFNDVYRHKPGAEKDRTHYCPGCGHGIVHKILAEALEDFDLTDRTILISPVGCSVFAYYYFNTGNFQVAHGRAPAVGTAVSRANPDSVVISYQGDGDLAAIGGNNILQAANRGENIMVVFINNAIYGMTGGQMAPTTLEGQKTTTTPYGRNPKTDGYPMKMSEVLSQLYAPVFVARTSLHNSANIRKTRDAIRKALQYVNGKKGFSFVEVLSMCPSGWKIQPDQGPGWIEQKMLPAFPLGVFRDRGEEADTISRPIPVMDPAGVRERLGLADEKEDFLPRQAVAPEYRNPSVRVSGFGGQGIMVIGQTLATVGMKYGYSVSWLPSYGPEMRGGTANCSVKIQDGVIGAMEATSPDVVIAMNRPSMEKFEEIMVPGGTLIFNSTLIEVEPERSDIRVFPVPVTGIADDLGNTRVQSTVAVGAFAAVTGLFALEDIVGMLPEFFSAKPALVEVNEKAVRAGYRYVKDSL